MSAAVPRPGPVVYWITRDRDHDGTLDELVDVWTSPPARTVVDDGAFWLSDDWSLEHRVLRCSLARASRLFGVVPDDDRMVIRAERSKPL